MIYRKPFNAVDGCRAIPWPYVIAHFAKSQLWHTSTLLFAFFLTESAGLTPLAMGWVLCIALVVNGAMDFAIGHAGNRRVTSVAIALRVQARAAPFVAGFFVLFACTPLLPVAGRLAWALTTVVAFRSSYALLDVVQNALVPMLATTAADRHRLLAARNIASSLANISVSATAATLLIAGDAAAAYVLWSAAVAGLAWWTATSLAIAPVLHAAPAPPAQDDDPRDPRFATVLVALAVMIAANTLFRAMEPFFAAFRSRDIGLLLCASCGAILGQPVWLALTRRHGAATMLVAASVALFLAAGVLASPARGATAGIVVIGIGYGAGASGLWLMLWSCMAAHADPRRPLSSVGSFTCVSKLAQGGAMLAVGHVLAASPYRAALSDRGSWPSLSMVAALAVMALVCLILAPALTRRRVSRTGRGETAATPRRSARQAPVPARQP